MDDFVIVRSIIFLSLMFLTILGLIKLLSNSTGRKGVLLFFIALGVLYATDIIFERMMLLLYAYIIILASLMFLIILGLIKLLSSSIGRKGVLIYLIFLFLSLNTYKWVVPYFFSIDDLKITYYCEYTYDQNSDEYYYLLNFYRDDKVYLKKMIHLRDSIQKVHEKDTIVKSISFLKSAGEMWVNDGICSTDEANNSEYIQKELEFASFYIEKNKSSYRFYNTDNNRKITKLIRTNDNEMSLYFDYEDLDREILQELYNTMTGLHWQYKNIVSIYKIYNNKKDKQLDVIVRYKNFGKEFIIEII